MSVVFDDMLQRLEALCPTWIKLHEENFSATKEYFFAKYNFPGIIGCIDGTHIGLLKPSSNEHMFYNRKGFHSINAMVICDQSGNISAVNALYGGAAHDSFVWNMSTEREYLKQRYLEGDENSWLLGDSGYPNEPFLISPYRAVAEDTREAKFNYIHAQARSCVERAIGVLKGRWRILLVERKCRYAPEKLIKIINVCVALHNMSIKYNISDSDIDITFDQRFESPANDLHYENENLKEKGKRIRNTIKNIL